MSRRRVDAFVIRCNVPGCKARIEYDLGDEVVFRKGEYRSPFFRQNLEANGWEWASKGKHFCPEHRFTCPECHKYMEVCDCERVTVQRSKAK